MQSPKLASPISASLPRLRPAANPAIRRTARAAPLYQRLAAMTADGRIVNLASGYDLAVQ